ncbi:MAG: DUF6431 domain-containing protein [Acidimicrobiia bacterium]
MAPPQTQLAGPMQILHPFSGSIQEYKEQLGDPDAFRPGHCPLCQAKQKLRAHGFYYRTLSDRVFDGIIAIRRYLCLCCWRTVSLLPELALPYLRFSVPVVGRFLRARFLEGQSWCASAEAAAQPEMPYQRGQQWARRFAAQAEILSAALAALTAPTDARRFVVRAVQMLETVGWVEAHRFVFSQLRIHLLGWPDFLAPDGVGVSFRAGSAPA